MCLVTGYTGSAAERVSQSCVRPERSVFVHGKQRKKRLTFDFFIWNDRSKSSVSESLFYFTSTGRKGVVIILCAHIQYLNQQYPIKVEKGSENRNRKENEGKNVK